MRFSLFLGAALLAVNSGAVHAEDAAHPEASADIVVTAPFTRERASVLSSVSVIQGTELTRQIRSTIGETLSRQAGVSSTAFGPNASRPILRGFQGERIRVLSDGIGSFDVSNTSVDHAVVINPQLAERIEVLRGPASLLYGSSAVGGVVNVLDTRIPRSIPDEAVHIDLLGSYGSAADERSGGAVVNVPLSDRLVAHFDGSYLKTGDLDIGGYVLSPQARAQALASPVAKVRDLADLKGTLANSAARTTDVAGGLTFIDPGGTLGFAVSHYDSNYGIPARYDLTTGEGEEVHLAVKQTRVDARAGINFSDDGFFDKVTARFGFADYQHQELSDTNVVNTTFLSKSFEGRIELAQNKHGVWQGATGVQYLVRDFDVIGAEAFLPRNSTTQGGIFTLQSFDFGTIKTEVAGRIEHSNVSTSLSQFRGQPNDFDRSFTAYSGSAGASVGLGGTWRLGLDLSHTERAPAAEELLANGPHGGTQAYEIGYRTFRKETGNGSELTLRGKGEGYSFEASAYYTRFKNYIYEAQTGDVIDGLPVFQARAADARYYGAEIQGSLTLAQFGGYTLAVDALGDYVNAKLLNGLGPVPRIPPLRVLGGATLNGDLGEARLEAEHAFKQDRISPNETEADAYTLVNASLTVKPFRERPELSVVLSANNIFDVDARRHASFLQDFAPLPGRDLRASVRLVY